MLFTDSDIITSNDLVAIDSEASAVSGAMNKIPVDGVQSVIRQAWGECASKLKAQLQTYSSYVAGPGISPYHQAAVMGTGIASVTAPRAFLNQIVVHNWQYANALSTIQLWIAYTALKILYQNASNRLGKDRYEEKMKLFESRAANAWAEFRQNGLPCVFKQMDCPGAIHAANAGTFAVTTASAVGATGGSFLVALTYYDSSVYQSQTDKRNGESGPSAKVLLTVAAAQGIAIDITGLVPPNGQMPNIGISEGFMSPYNATHWNIYVGATTDGGVTPVPLYYQASVPIATKTYTFTADPVLSGTTLQAGQYPDRNLVFGQKLVMRG